MSDRNGASSDYSGGEPLWRHFVMAGLIAALLIPVLFFPPFRLIEAIDNEALLAKGPSAIDQGELFQTKIVVCLVLQRDDPALVDLQFGLWCQQIDVRCGVRYDVDAIGEIIQVSKA